MTGNTKRAIAYGSALGVTILALVAVFVDHRREATFFKDARDRHWPVTPAPASAGAGSPAVQVPSSPVAPRPGPAGPGPGAGS